MLSPALRELLIAAVATEDPAYKFDWVSQNQKLIRD
jgi:hypothetical protein